jgi:hypothetical protein
MPHPGRRLFLTAVGIAAAAGGIYFLGQAAGSLWEAIKFLRHGHGVGLMMGSLFLLFAGVFLMVSAPLLAIAGWGIEPRRRWKEWRNRVRA